MAGVALKISVDNIQALQRVQGMERRAANSVALAKIAGEVMRDSIEQTFAEEGSPAGSWQKVSRSTLGVQFGRRSAKKRRFKAGGVETAGFIRFAAKKKILQDTGRLKNSIEYRPASSLGGAAQMIIGTNVIYSRIHQFGGTIRAKRARALRFMISTPAGLQWVTKRSVNIPARPYLVFRPEDPRKIAEAVEDYLTQAPQ